MQAYHKNISLATGVNVGVMVLNDFNKNTIFKSFEILFELLVVRLIRYITIINYFYSVS